MLKDCLDKHPDFVDKATEAETEEAVAGFVHHHNCDSPHEGWITYRLGDVVKHKKIHFLPFMRFVCHRG